MKISELDKWDDVYASAQEIEEFFYFLCHKKRITLCKLHEEHEQFYPITESFKNLIYEYFDIDPIKLEQERRNLLEEARSK